MPGSSILQRITDTDDDGNKRDKSYKIVGTCEINQIIKFLFDDLNVKESLLISQDGPTEATDYLDLALEVPEGVMNQKYIILDNQLILKNAFNFLYCQLNPDFVESLLTGKEKTSNPRMKLIFMKKSFGKSYEAMGETP